MPAFEPLTDVDCLWTFGITCAEHRFTRALLLQIIITIVVSQWYYAPTFLTRTALKISPIPRRVSTSITVLHMEYLVIFSK